MCPHCESASNGDFDGLRELVANVQKNTYLCSCRHCGALWMGHAYTPQLMLELAPTEAAQEFPEWRYPTEPPHHK